MLTKQISWFVKTMRKIFSNFVCFSENPNFTSLNLSLWWQRRVAGVNNVRYWLRTYASMYASKLGLADYISGRTNQNQCRVASFPLYKKGDKVHFLYLYIIYFVNTKMKLVVSVYLVQKMIRLWILLPVWASSDHRFSSDIWVLKIFALSIYRNPTIFNVIRWLAGSMGWMAHWPSVWCSKNYFFF